MGGTPFNPFSSQQVNEQFDAMRNSMTTVYQCSSCGNIVNTVWNWSGKQLCRVCFGRERLGDMGTGGVVGEKTVRLVRGDGSVAQLDPRTGQPILGAPMKEVVTAGDASTRKIRLVEKDE
jgi:hypothetical protein